MIMIAQCSSEIVFNLVTFLLLTLLLGLPSTSFVSSGTMARSSEPIRTQVSAHITFNEDPSTIQPGRHSHYGRSEGNITVLEQCPARVNNLIGNSLKQLVCKPRPEIVRLTAPGPNYDLVPSVATVHRCNGFCRSSTSCLPTKVSKKQVLVHQIDKARGGGMFGHECGMVELEEHDECKCHCEIQPTDCSHKQKYDPGSCSCLCTNLEEQNACERQQKAIPSPTSPATTTTTRKKKRQLLFSTRSSLFEPEELQIHRKVWNPKSCSCDCVTENKDSDNNNCPNDLMWIPKLCRCVRIPMIPPDSRFGFNSDETNDIENDYIESNEINDDEPESIFIIDESENFI